MSGRLNRLDRDEDGSLMLTLLATIVVAGLIAVLLTRSVAGERAVRFDEDFAETVQVADVGVNRGLFALNEGAALPTSAAPATETVDGVDYTWWAEQISSREWEVHSQGETGRVRRHLVATIEDEPLFFPGAFGDTLVALNGTSTEVDSYNSDPTCTALSTTCGWGNTTSDVNQQPFGTGNGSIGTNEKFDFAGNTSIRPGGAFLYDWAENPANGMTATDPFGDRCDGNPCTTTYVSTVPERLDLAADSRMEFITEKFSGTGPCTGGSSTRRKGHWTLGDKNTTTNLVSYYTAAGLGTPTTSDATDDGFDNYYCADTLTIRGDIRLPSSVTPSNPVVIFVKDYVTAPDSGSLIGCHNANASTWCSKTAPRAIKPQAGRLQIFVAGLPSSGSTAGDISFKSQVMLSGVVYAPRSRCGSTGGGGIDIYGAIICGSMDNVGNWDFHYDDALSGSGSGQYSVAFWQEVDPVTLP